jgi:hypothetical protein
MTNLPIENELRLDKLANSFKRLLLQFPVLPRSDVRSQFAAYTEVELDAVAERLLSEGFITIAHGKRGGVRYVRNVEVNRG